LLLAEARRLGVALFGIDVNRSTNEYRVDLVADGSGSVTKGIRLSFVDVQGISGAETERIIAGQPYENLTDFFVRARPSRRTFERLALVGAFDDLVRATVPTATRGDIVARAKELNALKKKPELETKDSLFYNNGKDHVPIGNPEPTAAEKVAAELGLLGLDITQHALEEFRPMLDELGVSFASELSSLRNKTNVLVAGVRVATQTPPMRSGKRVVFVSLDDGSGVSDATFFEDAQERCSHILFNNKLLLVGGKIRRTGVRGISIMAENAWDIRDLWRDWQAKQKLKAADGGAPDFGDVSGDASGETGGLARQLELSA
jgi:error-prone DNA polymerase